MFIKLLIFSILFQLFSIVSAIQTFDSKKTYDLFDKGIDFYNRGRYYSALDIFRKLKNFPPEKSPQLTASTFMFMKSYIKVKRYEEAKNVAREFIQKYEESRYLPYIYFSLGDLFLEQGYYTSAIESYLKSRKLFEKNLNMTNKIDQIIMKISSGYITYEEIDRLLSSEIDLVGRSILSLAMAKTLLYKNEIDEAAVILLKINSSILPIELISYFEDLKKQTYKENNISNKTIGIIISSSNIENLAFLSGIRAAIKEINQTKNLSIDLEIMDIDDDVVNLIESIDILSKNSNLMAVIGPLNNYDDIIFAVSAKNLSIPVLLPSTYDYGISQIGDNIFQMKTDYILQGRYAANYAFNQLNAKTVGILSPNDKLGIQLTDGFLIEADILGMDIISIEWYSGIPIDISVQLSNLRKEALQLYSKNFNSIDENILFDSSDSTFDLYLQDFSINEDISTEDIDSSKIIISDIDIMFLPIHKGDISYITSQFSSYGIDSKIIGNNNWFSPEEFNQEMIGSNLNDMTILTDHYIDENSYSFPNSLIESVNNYQNRNEIELIFEGYDLTIFLSKHLEFSIDRASLLQSISNTLPIKGISKTFAFSENSRSNATINFINFKNNQFYKVGYFIADSLHLTSP
tara:strand:+ start:2057 stop:3952 length:1896 start_codon:yes stop_codon:yes gene_type:complete